MINTETFELISKKFGTPAYVYEQEMFRQQLLVLANAIYWRPLAILYAVKANSSFRVLRTLASQRLSKGVTFGVDAVSPGEVALALRAGVPSRNIIFTGNNASKEEIEVVHKNRIMVNIDAAPTLHWFGKRYPGSSVCIRINSNVGAGHHSHCITGGPDSKFGIWFSKARSIQDVADKYDLKIVGVHQHIGSQILDPETFLYAMDAILQTAPVFRDLNFVDFGGGFGVPYSPEENPLDIQTLGKAMSEKFAAFCKKYGRQLQMIIEPGRYLTAQAGYLLVRVTTVKHNPDSDGGPGKVFVGVDSGFNHLDRPARYGSYHHIVNISNPNPQRTKVIVVGNLCESGDKFTPEEREVAGPKEGDLLVIENAGAYGFCMSSNYNLRPKPPEIMVTPKGVIREIRKRQTVEELVANA